MHLPEDQAYGILNIEKEQVSMINISRELKTRQVISSFLMDLILKSVKILITDNIKFSLKADII